MSYKQSWERHHAYVRVLAFLIEQKVATGPQIFQFCFHGLAKSYAWKTISALEKLKWIERSSTLGVRAAPTSIFSATKDGFYEFRKLIGFSLEKTQLQSNYPPHDIRLTHLRILFSRIKQCRLFLSENTIQMKIFEDEIPQLSIFRSLRADSAVSMALGQKEVWMSLEYERMAKSNVRYTERLKKWYQSEELDGVLLVAESELLKKSLIDLDLRVYPNLKRKILFSSLENLLAKDASPLFQTSTGQPMTRQISEHPNIHFPILDQNISNLRSSIGYSMKSIPSGQTVDKQ